MIKILTRLLVLVLWFLVGYVMAAMWQPAHASVYTEVGAGVSAYTILPDGTWYQRGAPGDYLATHGRAFSVGVADDFRTADMFGIVAHADYVNLGHIRTYCDCTTIDADYSHTTRLIAPGSPMAVYSGDGMVQGVKLSLAPYVDLDGYRLGVEAGLFVYRPEFTENVYGWAPAGSTQTENLDLHSPGHVKVESMFGFSLTHGRYSLSYEQFRMPVGWGSTQVPQAWNGARLVMVGYRLGGAP